MDFDDVIERFDEGVLSLLIPLGLLCGASLVQRAAKRFQRISQQHAFGVSACGLTGEDVARRLLTGCGLSDVAVVATPGRNLYHPAKREVQLTLAHFTSRSLTALAIAAHEVGHAQQFAAKGSLYRLRLICRRCCQGIAVAALLLLLGTAVMPLQVLGSALYHSSTRPGVLPRLEPVRHGVIWALLVLSTLAVVLQAAFTLPLERDASRRAREFVRKEGLIAPPEEAGFNRLLNAAWLTYAAAGARRVIVLLVIAVLTIVWPSWLLPDPARFGEPGVDFAMPGPGESSLPRFAMLLSTIRLLPLVVIGLMVLRRYRSYHRGQPSRAQRAVGHNSAALAALAQGDFAVAVKQLDTVIALLPGTAAAHYNRGSVFVRMEQGDHALADFDRALALDPELPEAHRLRGNVWLLKPDYDRALSDFDAAIQQAPANAAAWRDRGLTFLWRGDYARALADLDEAIRLDKTDAVAFNNRGVVHMKRDELAQARADLREAIRLNPNFPNPRRHLDSLETTCLSRPDPLVC